MRAIKRVDLSEVSETEADAFRNEVQLLQRLQGNKKIIKLFDYEERLNEEGNGTELFVVMEQGERDLANLLKEVSKDQELTDAKTKFYWEEMLETVDVVHQEKIIHSDLKPANFLIVNGTIKMLFCNLGLQTESHHFQLQMKNQLTLENRQVHMLFGVVILFLSGYTLRFVLNLNELHSILIPKNGSNSCPNTLPSWIHVSKTN